MTALKPNLSRTPDGRWLIRLNNSFYSKEHSACPRAQFYQLIAGLHDPSVNSMAIYGTCAHLAWQKWALGCDVSECIQAAVDEMLKVNCGQDWRTPSHLEAMLIKWFAEHKDRVQPHTHPKTGQPLVEWKWEFVIYEDSFAIVMLQGTIDLVRSETGLRVRDYKTTADRNIDLKLETFLTSTQFLTYELGMRECLGVTDASYEISGVFLRKDGKNEFKQSRVLSFENSDGQRRVEQHRANLQAFSKDLVDRLEFGYSNTGGQFVTEQLMAVFNEDYRPCHQGWGCPYRGITFANCDGDREFIINNSFDTRTFDAHRHNEH